MEEERYCGNCKNYCGHYVKVGREYKYLGQGHCSKSHLPIKPLKPLLSKGGTCLNWGKCEPEEGVDMEPLFRDILKQLKKIEEVMNDYFIF